MININPQKLPRRVCSTCAFGGLLTEATPFFDDKPSPSLIMLPEQCNNKIGPNQMSLATTVSAK
jgi:hypothetical protein